MNHRLKIKPKLFRPQPMTEQEQADYLIYAELRDQNISTYTYCYSEYQGKFRFVGNSIGFGIPYALQFTNPQKIERSSSVGYAILPNADPNGLYSPSSAEGTFILLKNPNGDEVKPVYFEPRMTVTPFKLPANIVAD